LLTGTCFIIKLIIPLQTDVMILDLVCFDTFNAELIFTARPSCRIRPVIVGWVNKLAGLEGIMWA